MTAFNSGHKIMRLQKTSAVEFGPVASLISSFPRGKHALWQEAISPCSSQMVTSPLYQQLPCLVLVTVGKYSKPFSMHCFALLKDSAKVFKSTKSSTFLHQWPPHHQHFKIKFCPGEEAPWQSSDDRHWGILDHLWIYCKWNIFP